MSVKNYMTFGDAETILTEYASDIKGVGNIANTAKNTADNAWGSMSTIAGYQAVASQTDFINKRNLVVSTGQTDGNPGRTNSGNCVRLWIPTNGSALIIAGQFGNSVLGGDNEIQENYLPVAIAFAGGQSSGLGSISYIMKTTTDWSKTDNTKQKTIRITQEWKDVADKTKGIYVYCTIVDAATNEPFEGAIWFIQAHAILLGAMYGNSVDRYDRTDDFVKVPVEVTTQYTTLLNNLTSLTVTQENKKIRVDFLVKNPSLPIAMQGAKLISSLSKYDPISITSSSVVYKSGLFNNCTFEEVDTDDTYGVEIGFPSEGQFSAGDRVIIEYNIA